MTGVGNRRRVTDYLCIGCPLGCRLEVETEGDDIVEVRGNQCRKGEKFARQEHLDPKRMVATTVAIAGATITRLPVHTAEPVPKDLVRTVCDALHRLVLEAPVAMGQVVLADVLGTGVDVVASRTLARSDDKRLLPDAG